MSIFASLGGNGDIWALSGISFASPVNDILEKGTFTLEELLEEDELIQEVKSKNDRLIQFLCSEETINLLIDYIITKPSPDIVEVSTEDEEETKMKNDLKNYKYPYMSCEVICCEVPELLKILVEDSDVFLDKLFSFLSTKDKLDHHLSGYFEKILEMLFRRMTMPMMKYLNVGGTDLLAKFLDHIDSYSIMQILQRLLLPHIAFSNSAELESIPYEEIKEFYQCNWSYLVDTFSLLFDKMFEPTNANVPLHISDLLITVLQLSPPETLVVKSLCEPECIIKLLDYVVVDEADMDEVCDSFSVAASISLSATSVLASLISRLFEASLPFAKNSDSSDMDVDNEYDHIIHVKESIEIICSHMQPYLPKINETFQSYISANPCKPLKSQAKQSVPRLGHRGLQLVKLIESIVRLGNLDHAISDAGILKTCLDLFFKFENNSLLHLSVQRILVNIIEGGSLKKDAQASVLIKCDLLNIVMTKLAEYDTVDEKKGEDDTEDATAAIAETAKPPPSSSPKALTAKHSSMMGHMILVSQALSISLEESELSRHDTMISEMRIHGLPHSNSNVELDQIDGIDGDGMITIDNDGSSGSPSTASGADWGADDGATPSAINVEGPVSVPAPTEDQPVNVFNFVPGDEVEEKGAIMENDQEKEPHRSGEGAGETVIGASSEEDAAKEAEEASLRIVMLEDPSCSDLITAWDMFVDNKLREILDHQLVGSYQANNSNTSTLTSELGFHGKDDDDDDDDDDRVYTEEHNLFANFSNEAVEVNVGDDNDFSSADVDFAEFDAFGESNFDEDAFSEGDKAQLEGDEDADAIFGIDDDCAFFKAHSEFSSTQILPSELNKDEDIEETAPDAVTSPASDGGEEDTENFY